METFTGRVVTTLPAGHRGRLRALAFSPDGRTLATGGSDSAILLWDCDALSGLKEARQAATPAELWEELTAANPGAAYRALGGLLAQSPQCLRLLADKLKPVRKEDAETLRGWIRDLDARRIETRRKAVAELEKLSLEWDFLLREALLPRPSLEVRTRLDAIREKPALRQFSPVALRDLRAVHLLERLGTDEAKTLLGRLAKGLPEAPLTVEARASLQRLGERKSPPPRQER
jgi:hypothetical protein